MCADWISDVLDLVYPRYCVECGGEAGDRLVRYLCRRCVRRLPVVWEPGCPLCGHPAVEEELGAVVCERCARLGARYGEGRTVLVMTGVGRRLVHVFKYHKGLYLLGDIRAIAERVPGLAEFVSGSVLVPVPLHWRKRKKRGFNQSEELAHMFSRVGEGCRVENLLRRTGRTETQTHLDPKHRKKNIEGVFAVRKSARVRGDLRYLLVDDVLTTGATINACARLLRKAGARRIGILTLAQG